MAMDLAMLEDSETPSDLSTVGSGSESGESENADSGVDAPG